MAQSHPHRLAALEANSRKVHKGLGLSHCHVAKRVEAHLKPFMATFAKSAYLQSKRINHSSYRWHVNHGVTRGHAKQQRGGVVNKAAWKEVQQIF